MYNVTIYSKKECHLCDIAKKELESIQREFDFSIKEVDIEKDKLAFEKFRYMIPVVEVDGKVISTGRVNKKKIKDILKQKSQLQ
jgi:glutaredoxin